MSSNWILYAKKKVSEQDEVRQAEREVKRQERAQTIRVFEEKLAKARLEIEEVLEEARKQGFGVEGPTINYSQSFRDTSPLYLWKVHDYGQGKSSHTIILHLVDRHGSLVPSITAQEVERDIRDWLFRIYSKFK